MLPDYYLTFANMNHFYPLLMAQEQPISDYALQLRIFPFDDGVNFKDLSFRQHDTLPSPSNVRATASLAEYHNVDRPRAPASSIHGTVSFPELGS
jgi:hypothetical protein